MTLDEAEKLAKDVAPGRSPMPGAVANREAG
jgi:hypothetical protein